MGRGICGMETDFNLEMSKMSLIHNEVHLESLL